MIKVLNGDFSIAEVRQWLDSKGFEFEEPVIGCFRMIEKRKHVCTLWATDVVSKSSNVWTTKQIIALKEYVMSFDIVPDKAYTDFGITYGFSRRQVTRKVQQLRKRGELPPSEKYAQQQKK